MGSEWNDIFSYLQFLFLLFFLGNDVLIFFLFQCLFRTPLNNYNAVILLHRDKLPFPHHLLFPSEINQGFYVTACTHTHWALNLCEHRYATISLEFCLKYIYLYLTQGGTLCVGILARFSTLSWYLVTSGEAWRKWRINWWWTSIHLDILHVTLRQVMLFRQILNITCYN